MKIETIGKILLSGLIAITFAACSDTKEGLHQEMKELKEECQKEAMILKANKDKEGFKDLEEECTEEGRDLEARLKALNE